MHKLQTNLVFLQFLLLVVERRLLKFLVWMKKMQNLLMFMWVSIRYPPFSHNISRFLSPALVWKLDHRSFNRQDKQSISGPLKPCLIRTSRQDKIKLWTRVLLKTLLKTFVDKPFWAYWCWWLFLRVSGHVPCWVLGKFSWKMVHSKIQVLIVCNVQPFASIVAPSYIIFFSFSNSHYNYHLCSNN